MAHLNMFQADRHQLAGLGPFVLDDHASTDQDAQLDDAQVAG